MIIGWYWSAVTFTFMHLADTFIQSDFVFRLYNFCQYVCSLGIEPMTFALPLSHRNNCGWSIVAYNQSEFGQIQKIKKIYIYICCIYYSKSNQIKSNHFYCHITTAQVPWWVKFLWACSRQCRKTTDNLPMDRQCKKKQQQTIYIWTDSAKKNKKLK